MSSYIDVEWLVENAKEYSLGYYDDDEWATPLNVLDSAPSIDIVRCGECKYYNDDYTGKWCGRFRDPHGCRTDDFCSYGEREGK